MLLLLLFDILPNNNVKVWRVLCPLLSAIPHGHSKNGPPLLSFKSNNALEWTNATHSAQLRAPSVLFNTLLWCLTSHLVLLLVGIGISKDNLEEQKALLLRIHDLTKCATTQQCHGFILLRQALMAFIHSSCSAVSYKKCERWLA